jgi:hypothetical protein
MSIPTLERVESELNKIEFIEEIIENTANINARTSDNLKHDAIFHLFFSEPL